MVNFKNLGLKAPKCLIVQKANSKTLPLKKLSDDKICRSLIIRFEETWFDNLTNHEMNQTESNAIHGVLKTQLNLAAEFYKPARKYVIIQGSDSFTAILAFNCQLNNWVQIHINPIGHKSLESLAMQSGPLFLESG